MHGVGSDRVVVPASEPASARRRQHCRKTIACLAAGALLALCLVSAAHAGDELYLRWDDCLGDGGTYNKVFACDTDTGEETLVASFRLAQSTDHVTALALVVSIRTIEEALPSWWQCQTDGCRAGSVSVNFATPVSAAAPARAPTWGAIKTLYR